MTITRKQIIDNKYNEMRDYIQTHLGVNFFPSLDDVETSDILILIQMYFAPHYETGKYDTVIKDGFKLQNIRIEDDKFNQHYPFIKERIDFLIKFMKEQK